MLLLFEFLYFLAEYAGLFGGNDFLISRYSQSFLLGSDQHCIKVNFVQYFATTAKIPVYEMKVSKFPDTQPGKNNLSIHE